MLIRFDNGCSIDAHLRAQEHARVFVREVGRVHQDRLSIGVKRVGARRHLFIILLKLSTRLAGGGWLLAKLPLQIL